MKYTDIKREYTEFFNDSLSKIGVFFAFSDKQFEEGMKKSGVKSEKEIISIGSGGYIPKKNTEEYKKLINNNWIYEQVAQFTPIEVDEMIEYELCNYECYYTGDINDVIDILEDFNISIERIREVYKKNASKHWND